MKKVIGITGTIASGKSTVCRYLSERYGACFIDADKVGHEILLRPEVIEAIVRTFGAGVLDEQGQIDRHKLGALVFAETSRLDQLSAITHPAICRLIRERLEAFRKGEFEAEKPFCFVEAVELIRSGLTESTDECWVVWAEDAVRLERVMQRDHLSMEEAQDRLDRQWPQEEYLKAADRTIDGGQPMEKMLSTVDTLVREAELGI